MGDLLLLLGYTCVHTRAAYMHLYPCSTARCLPLRMRSPARACPRAPIQGMTTGLMAKYQTALRNASIMNMIGNPEVEKLLAKEADEKRKRRMRLAAMNQSIKSL